MADTYTEGVCHDGAAILRNGERMTIAEILAALNATTTPPADAALADSIDSLGFVISGDNPPVKEWVSECGGGCMPATKEEKMMWDVLQSALRARAVPEGKKYHDVAQRLYALLDDIDTAGDIAKSDDKLYRGIVERTQAKKRDYVVSCDGYAVILADDSMLAASKEAK